MRCGVAYPIPVNAVNARKRNDRAAGIDDVADARLRRDRDRPDDRLFRRVLDLIQYSNRNGLKIFRAVLKRGGQVSDRYNKVILL